MSMFSAHDKEGNKVYIENTTHGTEYFCPVCGSPVVPKKGNVRIHHFAHSNGFICPDKWNYDMSDWHKNWQERFPENYREVVVDNGSSKHRADVLINKSVIEFQHSRITYDEFAERNRFYTSLGHSVIWVFDFVDEYRNCSIEQRNNSEEKYIWHNAPNCLNEFDSRNGRVSLFFQLVENGHDEYGYQEETMLLKISWISPDTATYFSGHEWLTVNDFMCKFNLGVAQPSHELCISDIYDNIIEFRRRNNCQYYYACPLDEKKHIVPFENCCSCEYNRDGEKCIQRFQSLLKTSIDKIIDIQRDIDRRIISIRYMSNGFEKKCSFDSIPSIGRTIVELYDLYNPVGVIWMKNIKNGNTIQLTKDPSEMLNKYGKIYGKIKRPGRDFYYESVEIYSASEAIWFVVWFK